MCDVIEDYQVHHFSIIEVDLQAFDDEESWLFASLLGTVLVEPVNLRLLWVVCVIVEDVSEADPLSILVLSRTLCEELL